jgi:alpha-tubulin suppressor-like RCC1 family protein
MLSGCGGGSKFTISGRIILGGSGLSGATVRLSGQASKTAKTDANGNYSFSDVSTGDYTVTPSFTGVIFKPQDLKIVVDGIDATGIDFNASGQGRIVATTHNTFFLTNGTVWAWGDNSSGQIGKGTTTTPITTPVQVSDLTDVTAIAAGAAHAVALKKDGTVWTWGDNSNGQLGNGSTSTQSLTPVQVGGLTDMTAIAAGANHTVALKKDGTVWTWGDNSNGQLGDGSTTQSSTPVKVSSLTGITDIAAGNAHTVARKNDGTVWTWGDNSNGQLGNGNTTQKTTPVQVSDPSDSSSELTGVTTIAAGAAHTVALKNDGTVRTWGDNSNGQLGDGKTTQKKAPVQVSGLSKVIAISAGGANTAALKDDGTAWIWGNNSNGQIGNGTTTTPITTPVQVSDPSDTSGHLTSVIAIAAGDTHTVALKFDGIDTSGEIIVAVLAWGDNSEGQIGNGTATTTPITTPVQVNVQ